MPIFITDKEISRIKCDAVINPSNYFLDSFGVDSSVIKAAGENAARDVAQLGGCRVGEAKMTKSSGAACKYVIHTCGPSWKGGNDGEESALALCYKSVLEIAKSLGCKSISIPLISSGLKAFPKERVMSVALAAIEEFLDDCDMNVNVVVFNKSSFRIAIDDREALESKICGKCFGSDSAVKGSRRIFAAFPSASPPVSERDDCFGTFIGSSDRDGGVYDELNNVLEKHRNKSSEDYDESFSEMLLRKIDERGITDAQCYKKANIDRKLFSKIRSNKDYRPSKYTVLAFAISLEMDINEAEEFLRSAGYAFTDSIVSDIIVKYYISKGNYDIHEINSTLFYFDQKLLGL